MRLIDADALKVAFKESESYHARKLPYDVIIDNAPTVERPQGEWKLHGMIYYCSECGHECGESGDNFCGNCGADMRGKENENSN